MEPTNLTARSPEDLVAMAPLVLGFQPEESLVMLTFGEHAFHARLDLPGSTEEIEAAIGALLGPVLAHGLDTVALVVFSRRRPPTRLTRTLLDAFSGQGIDVIDMLHADGRRWFPLRPEGRGPGVSYDLTRHPFAAAAVLQGQVTFSSRRALAASLEADPAQVARLAPLLDDLAPRLSGRQRPAEATWLRATMSAADAPADEGSAPPAGAGTDTDRARLLRDLTDPVLWEVALLAQRRDRAATQIALWTEVLRAAPPGWVAGPAALVGFCAWLGGQGALAWCAVDRCLIERSDDPRALLLADLLLEAVPPRRWSEIAEQTARDPA